jgi:hypothetical protein
LTVKQDFDLIDVDTLNEDHLTVVQAKYLVFLKPLGGNKIFVPANAKEKFQNEIQSVEVLWDDKVHLVYFHVPLLTNDLTVTSCDNLINDLDVSSQEQKLGEVMKNIKHLYREGTHQHGFGNILSIKYNLTWVMFMNALLMNFLILIFYTTKETTGDILSDRRF